VASQPAHALRSGGASGSEEGTLRPLQLPWARTQRCAAGMLEQVIRLTGDMADLDLVLAKLAGFEPIPCASSSQNHRIVWARRDFTDHLVPTPLPWAGTPSTRPGCSKPHPT